MLELTDDMRDAISYAMRVTAGRLDADDLEQEAQVTLLESGRDVLTIDRPLLFTIVKRKAIDMVRRAALKYERPAAYQMTGPNTPSMGAAIMRTKPSPLPGPHEQAEATLLGEQVAAAMEQMNVRDATAMRLHIEGLTGPEIAERMGVKPQTARLYLARAREMLRASILLGEAEGGHC